jgi:hypothetical protein
MICGFLSPRGIAERPNKLISSRRREISPCAPIRSTRRTTPVRSSAHQKYSWRRTMSQLPNGRSDAVGMWNCGRLPPSEAMGPRNTLREPCSRRSTQATPASQAQRGSFSLSSFPRRGKTSVASASRYLACLIGCDHIWSLPVSWRLIGSRAPNVVPIDVETHGRPHFCGHLQRNNPLRPPIQQRYHNAQCTAARLGALQLAIVCGRLGRSLPRLDVEKPACRLSAAPKPRALSNLDA